MSEKKGTSKLILIVPLLILISAVLSNIYFYKSINYYKLFAAGKTSDEIKDISNDTVLKLGYNPAEFNVDIFREVRSRPLNYVQYENLGIDEAKTLPLFEWIVNYNASNTSTEHEDDENIVIGDNAKIETPNSGIVVKFGPEGQLTELSYRGDYQVQGETQIRRSVTVDNSDDFAKAFLADYTEIDTSKLDIQNRSVTQRSSGQEDIEYKLLYTRNGYEGLEDVFYITINNDRIKNYNRVATYADGYRQDDSLLENTLDILTGISWGLVVLVAIFVFITKARKEQLDFIRVWWVAGLTFLTMVGIIASQDSDWVEIVFGGILGGGFVGIFTAFVYSTGESITRESWKEKLRSIDLIFNGKFKVRQIGESILMGIQISGLGLLLTTVMKWLLLQVPGSIISGNSVPDVNTPIRTLLTIISGNFLGSIFIAIAFFLIWGSFIAGKTKSNLIRSLSIGVLIAFAGMETMQLSPQYLSFLGILPVSLTASYVFVKKDFLSIFTGVVLYLLLMSLQESLATIPEYFTLFAIAGYGILGIIYLTGIFLALKGADAQSFGEYDPEYVSRLKERQRMKQELRIAHNVQMDLLPHKNPDYKQAEIESICLPATEVGGDYFDFFPYNDSKLGLVIGDVSGKGVPAAFYMTMVKGILKTLAKQEDNAKDILCKLNTIFCENAPKNIFISAIFGVLDFDKMQINFARAGHMPLIVMRKESGEYKQFTPGGMAIGLNNTIKFDSNLEEKTIRIDSGDLLLFFTDGISEATNPAGEEFGDDRLLKIVEKNSTEGPGKVIESIKEEVTKFEGSSRRHDDITAVAIKVN